MDTLTTAPTLPPGAIVQIRVPWLCSCGCGRIAAYIIFEAGQFAALDWLAPHGGEKHRNILTMKQIQSMMIVTSGTS